MSSSKFPAIAALDAPLKTDEPTDEPRTRLFVDGSWITIETFRTLLRAELQSVAIPSQRALLAAQALIEKLSAENERLLLLLLDEADQQLVQAAKTETLN